MFQHVDKVALICYFSLKFANIFVLLTILHQFIGAANILKKYAKFVFVLLEILINLADFAVLHPDLGSVWECGSRSRSTKFYQN
jgi:hypothetical protein